MVNKKKLPIRWDKQARTDLKAICDYIEKSSPDQAQKVKRKLLKLVSSLNDFPEKYSKEPYLLEEPENYRSVSKWNYKIIYEVTEQEIIIAMIFGTYQDPYKIKKP